MKTLILSITTGQGHNSVANALASYYKDMGVECEVLDVYDYIAPLLKDVVAEGYLASTAYVPKTTSRIYHLAEKRTKPAGIFNPAKIGNLYISHELNKYLNISPPDLIICTHVFAAALVGMLKQKGKIKCLTAGVVTDFTIHPFWEEATRLDYIITASELLKMQFLRKGFPEEKMLPFGIPIHPKFSISGDKAKAREELSLDKDKKTVLVMSGSMGYGRLDKAIEKLDNLDIDFQGIVVCGNNKKMEKQLNGMEFKKDFKIFGYVNNVDVLMDASDVIISKPGGITSSESMAKELPMIMLNPIPGQEERNVEFMLNNGLALYATKTFPLDEALFTLFARDSVIKNLQSNIKEVGKKNSTKNICEFLLEKANERSLEV